MKIDKYFSFFFILSIIEILSFISTSEIQILCSIVQYLIISALLLYNFQFGLKIFFGLSIVSFGAWSVTDEFAIPYSFLDLRLGFISFHVLYMIFIFGYKLILDKFRFNYKFNIFHILLIISFLIGVIQIARDINFIDNFANDIKLVFTFFLIYILSTKLSRADSIEIIKSSIIISLLLALISIQFNIRFDYGSDNLFLPISGISFFLPLFLLIRFYDNSLKNRIIQLLSLIILFSGSFFISGKALILFFLAICFYLVRFFHRKKSKHPFLILFTCIFSFYLLFSGVFDLLDNVVIKNPIVQYKFNQIKLIFNTSLYLISNSPTSIGNIFAEVSTIISIAKENILFALFGNGFGGAVYDKLGLLEVWAFRDGYNVISPIRDSYYKMHLPMSEIMVKSGLFGLVFYFSQFRKYITKYDFYEFLLISSLLLVFYVNKESIILTFILLRLNTSSN